MGSKNSKASSCSSRRRKAQAKKHPGIFEAQLEERRKRELHRVQEADSSKRHPGAIWFMLHRPWLDAWYQFVAHHGPLPGLISNSALLQPDGTPKPDLRIRRDYRAVNARVWKVLWETYSSDCPPICRFELDIYAAPVSEEMVCAIKIQAAFRGHRVRRSGGQEDADEGVDGKSEGEEAEAGPAPQGTAASAEADAHAQQQEAIRMLASLRAAARMRVARQCNLPEQAREAAAVVIEHAWRHTYASRARRRRAAALLLQRQWRGHAARMLLKQLRRDASAVRIQALVRGCRARAVATRLRLQLMRVWRVTVESAADLRPSRSRGARDALVLVTAHMHDSVPASVLAGLARGGSELSIMSSASTAKAAGAAEARAAAALDGVPGVGAQAFRWSSKVAKKSNEPHWAEETVIPGLDGNASLVFTVQHKEMLNTKFLGQAVLPLRECLRRGGAVELPLAPLRVMPRSTQGRAERMKAEGEVSGTLRVRVQPVGSAHETMCGWLWKVPGQADKASTKLSRRWCVLAGGAMAVFPGFGASTPRSSIALSEVNRVQAGQAVHSSGAPAAAAAARAATDASVAGGAANDRFFFTISAGTQARTFAASSEEERQLWLQRLRAASQTPRRAGSSFITRAWSP